MTDCCEIQGVDAAQRRVLRAVLWLNVAMFVVEVATGVLAHSTALLSDGFDMLGDAIVYGFSLYVVGRGPAWKARGALLKGVIMAIFAAGVAAEAAVKLARGLAPSVDAMWSVGLLALAVNGLVLVLLWRRRDDDMNMRSAWLCSRNDVVANVSVLIAALGVSVTGSAIPDVMVGLGIAALFGVSAVAVARRAYREIREPAETAAGV